MLPGGPCKQVPVGFSEFDLNQIIETYSRAIAETYSIPDLIPSTPISDPVHVHAGNLVSTGDKHQW